MGIQLNQVMGEQVVRISENTGESMVLVYSVLQGCIRHLEKSIELYKGVVIPGITSIKVIYDVPNEEYIVRGKVSPALKRRLLQYEEEGEAGVTLSTDMVYSISNALKLPIKKVDFILREFIEGLLHQAETKGEVYIPNISRIRVERDSDGELFTRGRVSPALQRKIKQIELI